jgi:hypothetical protein
MYDALAREHIHMEQDRLRRQLEKAARFPSCWDDEASTTCSTRRRWPRLRGHALRAS